MMSGSGRNDGGTGTGGTGGAVSTGGDGVTGTDGAGEGALAHAATRTATNGRDRRMLSGSRRNAHARAQVMRPARRARGIYRVTHSGGIMRRAMTAIEVVVVLSVITVVLGIVLPTAARLRDGIAVRNATAEAMAAFATARRSAIVRGAPAALGVDRPPGFVTVSVGGEMLLQRALPSHPSFPRHKDRFSHPPS